MNDIYDKVVQKFRFETRIKILAMTSSNASATFFENYFDFVYIDGNHLYEFVKQDLELFYSKIKNGGFIVGDDYGVNGWWNDGITKAVNEFVETNLLILSVKNNQFRMLRLTEGNRYLRVKLCKNNMRKIYLVHRLILKTFISDCPKGMQGCHNDGNPSNNFIENLRWDTCKRNMADKRQHKTENKGSNNGMSKLNEKQVRIIKYLLKENILSIKEIAKIFDVHIATIYYIKDQKIWKHVKEN